MITAQWAKGKYRYYRCTKKFGKCSQRYLREDLLVEQLREKISKVALCEDWKEKMLAKVEMWEKENIQSSQSFAQNLEQKIKETEKKIDKLVNAFLDGIIEKEIYLVKKNELIKTKTALLQKKDDFGRKGNNWVEPLKNWIKTAYYAKKIALSKDFIEIKSLVEKIGTNRQMLDRKIRFDFVRPFDLIPKYKRICEASLASGEASEQSFASKNSESLDWSQLLNEARTFFEQQLAP